MCVLRFLRKTTKLRRFQPLLQQMQWGKCYFTHLVQQLQEGCPYTFRKGRFRPLAYWFAKWEAINAWFGCPEYSSKVLLVFQDLLPICNWTGFQLVYKPRQISLHDLQQAQQSVVRLFPIFVHIFNCLLFHQPCLSVGCVISHRGLDGRNYCCNWCGWV